MKKLLLIALILTFAAGTAIAQQGGNGGGGNGNGNGKPANGQQGGGYGDPIDRMTELLDLTPEQVFLLEGIFGESQAVREEARNAMRAAAEAHRAEVHTQILGVLDDDQEDLWEAHQLEREALRQTLEEMGYGRGAGGNGNRGGGGRGTGDCNG